MESLEAFWRNSSQKAQKLWVLQGPFIHSFNTEVGQHLREPRSLPAPKTSWSYREDRPRNARRLSFVASSTVWVLEESKSHNSTKTAATEPVAHNVSAHHHHQCQSSSPNTSIYLVHVFVSWSLLTVGTIWHYKAKPKILPKHHTYCREVQILQK